MRKKLCTLAIVVGMIVLGACNKQEAAYSCDETINEWVKSNLDDIHKLTRTEWVKMNNFDYQKAAYVAFTQEQKLVFWQQKFQEVLQLNWKKEDIEHINSLSAYITTHSDIFADETPDDIKKDFDIFIYQWVIYAQNELKWEDATIANIIMTGFPTAPETRNDKYTDHFGGSHGCECHVGNVLFTTCQTCMTSNCVYAIRGCGAMWTESCDGVCD